MQRILFGLSLLFLVTFSSCDDGDMSVTTFNFSGTNLSKCASEDFLYKTEDNEAIILKIPQQNFANIPTLDQDGSLQPRVYTLTSADILVYRLYSANVNNAYMCASFTPAEPRVTEEWTAKPGATIEIITLPNYDSENGGILGITSYTHRVTLKNVIFTKGDSQMVFEQFVMGDYTTSNPIKFNFATPIFRCPNNNLLYKLNLNEALVAELDSALFVNQPTEATPRVGHLGPNNALIYTLFNQNITSSYYCSSIPQNGPSITNQWFAQNSISEEYGRIEVETQEVFDQVSGDLTGYKHLVWIKNVTFQNNETAFTLAEYYLGEFSVAL